MKKNLTPSRLAGLLLATSLVLLGCANRNKADIVDTSLENKANINGSNGESVGVRNKEFVLQKKKNLSEEVRSLEEKVRELDDRVYGNRDYETYGLWGKLRDCRNKLKEHASDFEAGEMARLSDGDYLLNWKANSDAKAGIEKSTEKLVAMSEEDLDDHIKTLNKQKLKLQEKEDEITDKLGRCKAVAH